MVLSCLITYNPINIIKKIYIFEITIKNIANPHKKFPKYYEHKLCRRLKTYILRTAVTH